MAIEDYTIEDDPPENSILAVAMGLKTESGEVHSKAVVATDGVFVQCLSHRDALTQLIAINSTLDGIVENKMYEITGLNQIVFEILSQKIEATGNFVIEVKVEGIIPFKTVHRIKASKDGQNYIYTIKLGVVQVDRKMAATSAFAAMRVGQIALNEIIKKMQG